MFTLNVKYLTINNQPDVVVRDDCKVRKKNLHSTHNYNYSS